MKQVRLLLLILLLVVPALACDALPGAEPTVAPTTTDWVPSQLIRRQ